MDNIYQSLKALLKSFLNLFLAVVDLFTGLINGLAAILVKLRPGVPSGKEEWKKISKKKKDNEEGDLVEDIRNELKQKVSSKEKYYYWSASASDNDIGFYAVVLSILILALTGTVMLYGVGSNREVRIFVAVVMTLVCAAACLAIIRCRKKVFRNRIVKQILEEEFSDKIWEVTEEKDPEIKSEAKTKIQPINAVGKEEIG